MPLRLSIHLTLARVARCPLCYTQIESHGIHFHKGTAFCVSCGNLNPRYLDEGYICIDAPELAGQLTQWKGLRLWTPPPHIRKPAYELVTGDEFHVRPTA